MAKHFFNGIQNKTKLIRCSRGISGAAGRTNTSRGMFIKLQTGKRTFQDRVNIIDNLKHNYILGPVLYRNNRFGTGRHYITINREMITKSILQATSNTILKTKGKVTLPPLSVSVVEIKMSTVSIVLIIYTN